MSKKLTEPMIEALYVALVQGSVWVGARWESANVGHVKSPSLTALIDRGMVMRNPRGEWELSRKGVRALADIEMITTDSYLNWVLGMRAVIENAHAEAAEMDERRTIARAFLSTPVGVVLTDDEIEEGVRGSEAATEALIKNAPAEAMDYARTVADAFNANRAPSLAEQYAGTPARFNPEVIDSVHEQALKIDAKLSPEFLAQQAENERAYAAIKDREEAERVDTLIEQLDGAPAEPEDVPQPLDIFLEQGMILVSPLDGERYRFERWTGGTAVLVNQNNGALIRVSQHDVTAWSYLPQASAEGIAAAQPQIVLEAALLRRVAAAEDARDEAQTQVSAVLHNIEQVAAYWARQSEREGFVPRAPWVALRCIVKEHTR